METTTSHETEIDLTQVNPSALAQLEAERLEPILNKLDGLKRIIAVAETRAKELLREDPDTFEGRWILTPDTVGLDVINAPLAAERILSVPKANSEEPLIQPNDLLEIAKFTMGKVRDLFIRKSGIKKKDADEYLAMILGDAAELKTRSGSLKKVEEV